MKTYKTRFLSFITFAAFYNSYINNNIDETVLPVVEDRTILDNIHTHVVSFLSTIIRNGILLPKLSWLTERKTWSSDREKLLKIKAKGPKFATFLRSLEQFIQTVKDKNNFGIMLFLNCFWRFLIPNKLERFIFKSEIIIRS